MFQRLPDVVKNLLIINVLFFLATLGYPEFMYDKFALYYPSSDQFMPHQLITHMFMHGGMLHLFGNMFPLFIFGPPLEMRFGSKRFLIYFMLTGLGAAGLHLFVKYLEVQSLMASTDPDLVLQVMERGREIMASGKQFVDENAAALNLALNTPTVGASGAVFGVLLAFGMLFPNTYLYLYFAIPIKAKHFVILYGGAELLLAFQNNSGDNVAHFAHLGGMLFGFILLRYWRNKRII